MVRLEAVGTQGVQVALPRSRFIHVSRREGQNTHLFLDQRRCLDLADLFLGAYFALGIGQGAGQRAKA